MTQAIIPPMNDAIADVASAAPARPCCAIRNPSKQVTIDDASPGVLIMMEAIEPPNMAP